MAVAGIIGMALSSIGTIGANLDADKTRSKLLKLAGDDPKYAMSPYAEKRFGLAQNLLNSRAPGAATNEQNIYGTLGAQTAGIDQSATDSSQALAQKAQAAAGADKSFSNLGTSEQQFAANVAVPNYNSATEAMTNETDKQYQDNVRRWQDQINILLSRHGIKQNEWQNVSNLGSSISSMGGSMGGK